MKAALLIIIACLLAWLGFYAIRDWRDTLYYQIRVKGSLNGVPGEWSSTLEAKAQQMSSFGPTSGAGRPYPVIKGAAVFIPISDGYVTVLLADRGRNTDTYQADLLEKNFGVLGASPDWDYWRRDWRALSNSDRSVVLKPNEYPPIIHLSNRSDGALFGALDSADLRKIGLTISEINIGITGKASDVSQDVPVDLDRFESAGVRILNDDGKLHVSPDHFLRK